MTVRNHNLLLNRTFQYFGIILVVVAIGGGYWYWKVSQAAQTVESDTPSFEAPLTHDLNLSKGQGVATYSRADGADRRATVTDFEGRIIPVKQNEARFEGARRVENLITYSEDPTNAAWANSLVSLTTGISDPNGGTSAVRMTATGPNAFISRVATPAATGRMYVHSIWIRRVSGSGSVLLHGDGIGDVTISQVTTSWKRFSNAFTTTDGNLWAGVRLGTSGDVVDVAFAQVEEVTGQSNQNPSEYVSTNVKTAFPYHGVGVDGVKYFDTQNGNTVASNVVTEATGTKITPAMLKGYLAEGSRTNLLLRSEEIDNATWNKSNTTVTANSVVAPSGQVTADTITATSGLEGAHVWNTSAVTITANATHTASVYLKRSNFDWIRVTVADNAGTPNGRYQVWANLNTGVLGTQSATGTGTLSGATITSIGNDWFRLTVTGSLGGGYTTAFVVVLSATADNSTTRVTDAQFYLWGTQFEQALFASSYIPTTSTSVTRASDSLSYPETGNFNDTIGTVSLETTPNWTGGLGWNAHWVADSSNGYKLRIWHWNGLANHTGVDRSANNGSTRNQTDPALTLTNGTMIKIATKWDGTALRQFNNGALAVSDTTLTLPYDSLTNSLFIGSANTIDHAFSSIKNVRAWKKALTDTEMNNLTSLTQATSDSAVKETTVKTPSNTGLVGYWSFEDGSGTKAEDFSPTGTNTGILTNGPTWVDGKIGKALNFDGTDDYIDAGNGPSLGFTGDITISAWINPSSLSDYDFYLAKYYGGGDQGYDLGVMADGRIVATFRNGTHNDGFSSSGLVQAGQWQHITVTQDSSCHVRIYKNGVLASTLTNQQCFTNPSNNLSIGNRSNSGFFPGAIDDVRLYDYALSASEVAGLYAQGNMGKTTVNANQNNQLTNGLVGLWSFNGPDLSGTTAYDRSGQGNNGTLVNGPTVYPGKVGQALSFDGTSASVNLGQPAVLQTLNAPMTISSWVRFPTAPVSGHNYTIIGRGYDWQIEILPTQRVSFRRWSSYSDVQGVSALSATSWYHVVVTVSTSGSDNVLIYVNGQLDKTGTMTTPFNTSASNTRISGYIQADIDYFNGLIDEVRIYNRALSAPEVAALYSMGR